MDVYKEWLGIPDGPRPPSHYELLRCVEFEDDAEKIRAHYKKLNAHVRKYATGQYSIQSQDLLNELAKAMLCLTDHDRKRDYDESLGREFPAEYDELGRQPMLDVLTRNKTISRDQAKEAKEFADRTGVTHRDAVVQLKFAKDEQAAQAQAIELGFSYVDLGDMIPEDDALDLVPRSLVKQHSFIPLFIDDGKILVACTTEPEFELEDELRLRYGVPVRPVITTLRAIKQATTQYYPPGTREEAKVIETASDNKSTKKSAGKSKTSTKKASKPGASFHDLSAEDKKQRRQYGILFICWSLILPMFPQILKSVAPLLAARFPIPFTVNLVFAILVCGGTTFWVTQKYWK